MIGNGAEEYNIATIRQLLHEAFAPEELRRFCQDRPTFRPVTKRFGPGHGQDDMADELITYCETRLLFPELLHEIQQFNPRQYARFFGRQPPVTSPPERGAKKPPEEEPFRPAAKAGMDKEPKLPWIRRLLSKAGKLAADTTFAMLSAGIAGLLGGIWIWILRLPGSPEVEKAVADCGFSERRTLLIFLQIMILIAGAVGGAGLATCIIGGNRLVDVFAPTWAKRSTSYQASALVITFVVMALGGTIGGAVVGFGASLGQNYLVGAFISNIISGAIMGGLLGGIAGGGIALVIVVAIAVSDALPNLPYRYALMGGIAGLLAGLAILFISTPATELVTGVFPSLGTGAVRCTLRIWILMVTSGPLRWLGATVVGTMIGASIAVQAGKRDHQS